MTDHTIWHHRIHQEWAGEELTFWRLAFFPSYDFDVVSPIIRNVMGELEVRSYAVYETMGVFDIFIRAWLPASAGDRFEQTLTEALAHSSLQLCESFGVTKLITHWVWDRDDADQASEPTLNTLAAPLGAERIEEINQGQLTKPEWQELEDLSIVSRRPLVFEDGQGGIKNEKAQKGVKFLIVIATSAYMTTYRERERVASDLVGILREHEISEASLYEGNGFGQFVMMGRVLTDDFYVLPTLAIAIDRASGSDTVRPYTFVSARPGLMMFEENMPAELPPEDECASSALELLHMPTGSRLAVRASVRMNWRRYLIGEDSRLTADDRLLDEGVIAPIVGFLNADGGHLVVGAVSVDSRYGPTRAGDHELLNGFSQSGDYILVGVDDEEERYEWDQFRLWLMSTIRLRIEPAPIGSMRIYRQRIEGRDICVIAVTPTRATWYYRCGVRGQAPTFFVREDGRTVSYGGLQADVYKRSRPRG